MPAVTAPSAFARVTQLAADRRVHRAFQWLHLHERQILQRQTELVAIPAPPFGERARAEWLHERFCAIGIEGANLDALNNVAAVIPARARATSSVVLSAHLDTVFPADTPIRPIVRDTRLHAPGACDNGAGLAALLALAEAIRHGGIAPERNLIFIGNVGEEGEGDLRGIRYLYEQPDFAASVYAHLVIDGAGSEVAVTEALGSRRFEVTLRGPGGHSWADAGRPNPIVALSRAIARLSAPEIAASQNMAMNVGTIEGGTATNVIPSRAAARFDFRSTILERLISMEVELHRIVEEEVLDANRGKRRGGTLAYEIKRIGSRPAGVLSADSPLYETLAAVDRHLNIATQPRTASTDANIPLSLGVPAVSLGAGGSGGGIHTPREWYDAKGRELGLRRILLLALALAGVETSRS